MSYLMFDRSEVIFAVIDKDLYKIKDRHDKTGTSSLEDMLERLVKAEFMSSVETKVMLDTISRLEALKNFK